MAQNISYTLGLDIGTGSVAAALIDDNKDKLIDIFIRTFAVAEVAKTGESLNLQRRTARGTRRRLRRRAHRQLRLRRLLQQQGMVNSTEADILQGHDVWTLRAEGLDRALTPMEWSAVLYHLSKHRGFQSNRKHVQTQDDGKVLEHTKANQQQRKDLGYRTAGEMFARDPDYAQRKRNTTDWYRNSIDRNEINHELKTLFAQQRQHGNVHASQAFEEQISTLLNSRRPVFKEDDIEKMVGYCTLEPNEKRAARACYSFERFVWLSKLNNMTLLPPNEKRRPLQEQERARLINLPFTRKSKITFAQIRKILGLDEETSCNLVRYAHKKGEDPEVSRQKADNKALFEAKGFHALRKAYEQHGLKHEWQRDNQNPARLNLIANTISLYREDERITAELSTAGIEPAIIEAVSQCDFNGFAHLSVCAIDKMLPYLEQGQRYDEAAASAGYHHSQTRPQTDTRQPLPVPDPNKIRNPVILRALNQARRLINAITRKYGYPQTIRIELARDIAKSKQERDKIVKEQDGYQKIKEQKYQQFIERYHREPRGDELLKMRLYDEQGGQCAYSQQPIDLDLLCDSGYVEIDHILPRSRSHDDSLNNKTLVLGGENQRKRNQTPFEYLGSDTDSPEWQQFTTWVKAQKGIRKAKRDRYLCADFSEEVAKEYRTRQINDTRWFGRELKTTIEQHLPGIDCEVVSGRLTALLRHRWGFREKKRTNDLHHGVDAAIVAAATNSMVQRLAEHNRYHETKSYAKVSDMNVQEKHFPRPWNNFAHDIWQYLNKPEFRVSRAVNKRSHGAAHEATVRAIVTNEALLQQRYTTSSKTLLSKLSLSKLPDIVGYSDPRNASLIDALRQRLEEYGDKGDKAFKEPFYRPGKHGLQGPLVRSVKLLQKTGAGVPVNQGQADNASMIRVDIFHKEGKYFAVPLYVADKLATILPNKAITANKPESEWPEMNTSYQFLCSLHSNEWIEIECKGKTKVCGYFGGIDRATGAVTVWYHHRDKTISKQGFTRIGVKTALSVYKYHIDILGRRWQTPLETRQPLRHDQQLP
jgi:CRISPR-associated endonuclease Csn1